MNKRNYAQASNYMCGTDALDILPFYVQTLNIPGISFGLPEVGGRSGTMINLASDTAQFSSLSLEILLDEDYQVFKDINGLITDQIDVETGTFNDLYFDFWTTVTDDMGKPVMKVEYYNCRIESVGDLSLDATNETTEITFALELKFDYYKIVSNDNLPTLAI